MKKRKGCQRLAVLLVVLMSLLAALVWLSYRYPLQIGTLRLCATVVFAAINFVCGMIWERAK